MKPKRWNTLRLTLYGAVAGLTFAVLNDAGTWNFETIDSTAYVIGGLLGGAAGGGLLMATASGLRNFFVIPTTNGTIPISERVADKGRGWAMRTVALWAFGVLACGIFGGLIGGGLSKTEAGSAAGFLGGAFAFACVRLWFSEKASRNSK